MIKANSDMTIVRFYLKEGELRKLCLQNKQANFVAFQSALVSATLLFFQNIPAWLRLLAVAHFIGLAVFQIVRSGRALPIRILVAMDLKHHVSVANGEENAVNHAICLHLHKAPKSVAPSDPPPPTEMPPPSRGGQSLLN